MDESLNENIVIMNKNKSSNSIENCKRNIYSTTTEQRESIDLMVTKLDNTNKISVLNGNTEINENNRTSNLNLIQLPNQLDQNHDNTKLDALITNQKKSKSPLLQRQHRLELDELSSNHNNHNGSIKKFKQPPNRNESPSIKIISNISKSFDHYNQLTNSYPNCSLIEQVIFF